MIEVNLTFMFMVARKNFILIAKDRQLNFVDMSGTVAFVMHFPLIGDNLKTVGNCGQVRHFEKMI